MQIEAMNVDRESPSVQRSGKIRFAVLLLGVAALGYVCTHSSVISTNNVGRKSNALDLPVNLKNSAQPVIKVRKNVDFMDNAMKVGVDFDINSQTMDVEATTDAESFLSKFVGDTAKDIGGELAIKADDVASGNFKPKVEFRRKWLAPGIAGFKTKVELMACADLANGNRDAKFTFGLRNKEKNTVELERTIVGDEIGVDERVKAEIAASLSFPDTLELGLDEISKVRQKLEAANLEIDLDKIALCIDLE